MMGTHQDSIEIAEQWLRENQAIALATVIDANGSTPRGCGSHMVIRRDGNFVGSVSGGCVEASVLDAARATIQDGKLRRLPFGVQDEQGWNVGLACGGRIEVMVEPLSGPTAHASLAKLNTSRHDGRTMVRAVELVTGECVLIDSADSSSPLAHAAAALIRSDRSQIVQIDGHDWFLRVYNPPFDLVVVGAVHIAQALCRMAMLLDFRVRVIDPRHSFATSERFPNVNLVQAFPDEALKNLTARSAVVVLSHDQKIDDPALTSALRSPAFYVGALGSKRTHLARLDRLRAQGATESDLTRIHGPVGLAIGAKTPEEIAISILAEITQVQRHPS